MATTTTVDEFDPLDVPEIATFYNRLKQQQGQRAADRYLLTVKPTGGMAAKSPTVESRDRNQEQKRVARQLSDPVTSTRSLHGSDAAAGTLLKGDETPAAVDPAVVLTPTVVATSEIVRELTLAPVPSQKELAVTSPTEVPMTAQTLETDSSVTAVTHSPKRERKPARSTAAVKQAFETALAELVAADQPFKRSHVLARARLGASFYDTYPLLRQKVDAVIANIGKPEPQPEGKTMPSETNKTLTATAVPETTVADEAVEPQPALTATTAAEADADVGTLETVGGTTLNHNHRTVTGLTWGSMAALAAHWRNERVQLQQQMSKLSVQLDTAVENAEAYERVLKLHTPPGEEKSHEE